MSGVLLKALAALLPVCALLVGSILLFCRAKSFFSFLQVFGRLPSPWRCYSRLRGTSPVSLDALGAPGESRSLCRLLECCSWSHSVSTRIFISRTRDEANGPIAKKPQRVSHAPLDFVSFPASPGAFRVFALTHSRRIAFQR